MSLLLISSESSPTPAGATRVGGGFSSRAFESTAFDVAPPDPLAIVPSGPVSLVYNGPADIVAQFVKIYRGALPGDLASNARALDDAWVFAEMVAMGEGVGAGWGREARLSTSHSFWTDQHAADRGLARQGGESDAVLIARLRTGPAAITLAAITQVVAAVVHAVSPFAPFYIVRVPVDVGAFADTACFCDADSRVTPTRPRITIALIPASLDVIKPALLDALRSKMPITHAYDVEEIPGL